MGEGRGCVRGVCEGVVKKERCRQKGACVGVKGEGVCVGVCEGRGCV